VVKYFYYLVLVI